MGRKNEERVLRGKKGREEERMREGRAHVEKKGETEVCEEARAKDSLLEMNKTAQ